MLHLRAHHRPALDVIVVKRKPIYYNKRYSEVMYHKIVTEICEKYGKKYSKELEIKVSILGAERLLRHLYDYNIPMALATNSTEQAVNLHATARPKLFGMFSHKVSATDPEVDRGKPNPDIYLVAAARFPSKPKPSNCLVFEDSKIGVDAAREAGMQVVMIPDRRLERELTRHATLVLRSLLDFKPELFGLPPFDNTKDSK
ncbi:hypothetical protein K1T71_000868 [Dendrolimus kikuchii]|uniref:Uncharacterized protein n=1 Tax=Dendrolimus kikuchii TaxID=765133 RepID=A0ACC1DGZ6_9NEOP|nr:hypothetical protein K1T71_000868 [Dendrolimus kikuchii]